VTPQQRRRFDEAIDAAIAVTRRQRSQVLARTKRRFNAAIAVALREALSDVTRTIARVRGALSGTIGVKRVWIKRRTVPQHTVRRHQRLVFYKLPETP
jgi:hypothetical protein